MTNNSERLPEKPGRNILRWLVHRTPGARTLRNRVHRHLERILQFLARHFVGPKTLRPLFHRWRGVHVGQDVFIGYDAIIETSCPELVTIKDRASIGIGTMIMAHFNRELGTVVIEEDAFIGPRAVILPNVVIGRAAVVTAGSVVTTSVPPMTMVQGNPAKPIATVGVPLREEVSMKEFTKRLKPIKA
jgi:acetyltransferase-like isoleucine patch superfamily enzyme